MASKQVIVYVCDVCGTEDMVETHVMTVDGRTVEAEACLSCWTGVMENFAPFSRAGRTPPKPRKVSKPAEVMAFPGEAWKFTAHALIRMGERHVEPYAAAHVADDPTQIYPGRAPGSEVRIRGKVKVVVLPEKRLVLTVSFRDEAEENVA